MGKERRFEVVHQEKNLLHEKLSTWIKKQE